MKRDLKAELSDLVNDVETIIGEMGGELSFVTYPEHESLRICLGNSQGFVKGRGFNPNDFGYNSIIELEEETINFLTDEKELSYREPEYFGMHVPNQNKENY